MFTLDIRKRFFSKYPNACASFVFNKKLNKVICYTYNFFNNECLDIINDETKQAISIISKTKNPFDAIFSYFSQNGYNQNYLTIISDCYYDGIVSNRVFTSIDEACDAINLYIKQYGKTNDHMQNGLISANFVNEDGELDSLNLFYMEISFLKTKGGATVCSIDNTFTNYNYYGSGLHSYGIKFLESLLADKGVSVIVGKAIDCDRHDSTSSLCEHYQKLGFDVKINNLGECNIIKYVDPYAEMVPIYNNHDTERQS